MIESRVSKRDDVSMNKFGLVFILFLAGCVSKKPIAHDEPQITKVSKLGIWQVDKDSCEKEAGKNLKPCRSLVYSFQLNCQIDLLGLKKPIPNQRVAAFVDGKMIAESSTGDNGVVTLTFEDDPQRRLVNLSLSIEGQWHSIRPFDQVELTLPTHYCQGDKAKVKLK